MKALNTIIGTLLAVSASAYAAPSEAATVYRVAVNHASGACMGSMQSDRTKTRARSMGVANIDAGVAEVKCGASTPYNTVSDVEVFQTALRNNSAASVDVDCMLEDGVEDGIMTVTTKYPKTITLAAGEAGWLDWTTDDNGGNNFTFPSLTCQLPTDVTISYTATLYQVDVGL